MCWSDCAGWSIPLMFTFCINRFAHDEAHIVDYTIKLLHCIVYENTIQITVVLNIFYELKKLNLYSVFVLEQMCWKYNTYLHLMSLIFSVKTLCHKNCMSTHFITPGYWHVTSDAVDDSNMFSFETLRQQHSIFNVRMRRPICAF